MLSIVLLDLPPELLEKVISKVDDLSFGRLNRTTSDIGKFLDKARRFIIHSTKSGALTFCNNTLAVFIDKHYDLQGFRYIKLSKMSFPTNLTDSAFRMIMAALKTYKIQANVLMFSQSINNRRIHSLIMLLNPTQIEILKPSPIDVDLWIDKNSLRRVQLGLRDQDVFEWLPIVMEKIKWVSISAILPRSVRIDLLLELIKKHLTVENHLYLSSKIFGRRPRLDELAHQYPGLYWYIDNNGIIQSHFRVANIYNIQISLQLGYSNSCFQLIISCP